MGNLFFGKLLPCGSVWALAFASTPAHAQLAAEIPEDAASAQPEGLEEIIVTAQRRSEALQTVPVSVTALTASRIEQLQIRDFNSLVGNIPNLKVRFASFGPLDLNLSMRGVRSQGSLVNQDAAVGIYVNGMYFARSTGANVSFIDMQRVEVLRGPQGTLFGRNTIGGAINIITAPPVDEFEGRAKVGFGKYDNFTASAVLNVPVSDTLSARFVVDHQQHSGFVKALVKPIVGSSEFTDQNQDYYRATLKATPSDGVTFQLFGDYLNVNQGSNGQAIAFFDTTARLASTSQSKPNLLTDANRARNFDAIAGSPIVFNDWVTSSEYNPPNYGKAYNAVFSGEFDLGFANLTSTSGYRHFNFHLPQDFDGLPVSISVIKDYFTINSSISQEIQLDGKAFDNKLSWIVGLYFFRENNRQHTIAYIAPSTGPLTVFDDSGNVRTGTLISDSGVENAKSSSRSIYGQLTYEIVPSVRLTAGARYVKDKRSNTVFQQLSNAVTGAVLSCQNLTAAGLSSPASGCTYDPPAVKFDYVPWTAGIDFQPNDNSLLYAKISKGFRSGGQQACCGAGLVAYEPYGPESVLSYEVGSKLTLLDDHLQINSALFYSKYTDAQQTVPQLNPATGNTLTITRNVGEATIKGAELEVNVLVGDLRLNGTLGLTDGQFTAGPYKDQIYPGNSKTSWSIGADYPVQISNTELKLHADYSWQSESWLVPPIYTAVPAGTPFQDILSPEQKLSLRDRPFGVLNASAALEFDVGRPMTLTFWGRNLTNKFYGSPFSQVLAGVNFFNTVRPGEPRTYGASLEVKF